MQRVAGTSALSRTADRSRPSPTLPKFDAMNLVIGTNRGYALWLRPGLLHDHWSAVSEDSSARRYPLAAHCGIRSTAHHHPDADVEAARTRCSTNWVPATIVACGAPSSPRTASWTAANWFRTTLRSSSSSAFQIRSLDTQTYATPPITASGTNTGAPTVTPAALAPASTTPEAAQPRTAVVATDCSPLRTASSGASSFVCDVKCLLDCCHGQFKQSAGYAPLACFGQQNKASGLQAGAGVMGICA